MLVKTFNAYDLQQLMRSYNRDYFSFEGYTEIINLFNDENEIVEVDPIGISCEFTEDDVLNIWDDYKHLFKDFPEPDIENGNFNEWCSAFVDELNWYTCARLLDNGNILYLDF